MLILANGVVYAVGDNSKGQLGNGATGTTESIVVPVMIDETTTLTGVKNIAAGVISQWHYLKTVVYMLGVAINRTTW